MDKIGHLLKTENSNLQTLLGKVKEIQQINDHFQPFLAPNLRKLAYVVNQISTRLIIMTANSAVATQIRYQTPDILARIKSNPALKHITYLHIKVSPALTPSSEIVLNSAPCKAKMAPLSMQTAQMVREMTEGLKDEKLKAAMLRIATRGTKCRVD